MATLFSAVARQARISPTKVRPTADLIRGKSVKDALITLEFDRRRASDVVRKVLLSAVANAGHRGGHDQHKLKVARIWVDKGLTLKRHIACSRGRATPILRRCCHIHVEVEPVV